MPEHEENPLGYHDQTEASAQEDADALAQSAPVTGFPAVQRSPLASGQRSPRSLTSVQNPRSRSPNIPRLEVIY